ncbi:DNA internalization-related competence protein ComEC/Rec2 [Pseudomonas sp. F1_0610]|uniref:DNA internalization-related competence protein ComEC/Rec2 n=1 Tax=Pseudomonas sp. F1_0610 TaxID=3114284 RepID=UPI0039C07026
MYRILLSIIAGNLAILGLSQLPNNKLLLVVLVLGLLLLLFRRVYWLGTFLLAFAWACINAQWALDDKLDSHWAGRVLWVEGVVVGLPNIDKSNNEIIARFQLAEAYSRRTSLPKLINVSWYNAKEVRAGERWRLALQLKDTQGLTNPHLFDFEAWALAQGIGATATVKAAEKQTEAQGVYAWRDAVRQRLFAQLPEDKGLAALIVGDASQLTQERWQLLNDTGTVHLFVISGQHIGIIAGLIYACVAWLGRQRFWPMSYSWLTCACLSAWLVALTYAWLAGFTVPVQRALLMLTVVLLWRWRYSYLSAWLPFCLALALVLLINPLVVLLNGFWLSFAVVGVLLLVFSGRLTRPTARQFLWQAQWVAFIGLFPVLIALGLGVSPIAPLANIIAIPYLSFIVLPLALIGAVSLPIPWLAQLLLGLAHQAMELLFSLLAWFASWQPAWQLPAQSTLSLLFLLLAVLLWLIPRGVFSRAVAVFLLLPSLFQATGQVAEGEALINVLDVGQGLAIVVRTKDKTLLYDTGNRFKQMDMGASVVVPYLQKQGVRHLDKIIISHAHLDHSGGLPSVLKKFSVDQLVSGEPALIKPSMACVTRSWVWNGVEFSQWRWNKAVSSNDKSCVLYIKTNSSSMLLMGDLERPGEMAFLKANPSWQADWLIAGHHGSYTSTHPELLAQIKPHTVLISRGRFNMYQHPHPLVIKRLMDKNIAIFDTAQQGAITVKLGWQVQLKYARQANVFWRNSLVND